MQYKYKYIFNCSVMSVITLLSNISLNLPIIVVTLQWNTELKSIKISIPGDSIGTICQNRMNGTIWSTFRSVLFRSNLDPEIGMDTYKSKKTKTYKSSGNKPIPIHTDLWTDPISIGASGTAV